MLSFVFFVSFVVENLGIDKVNELLFNYGSGLDN
jgi:hypothetical protein